ncbi:MAG: DUF799 domain-containing protein [Acidobacteriota bacterium]
MRLKTLARIGLLAATSLLFVGCAAPKRYDYTAFKESHPRSILVLPPVNNSPDVGASYSVLSYATFPLAEAGYYVFPVALVDETFRQNGLSNPPEMHEVAPAKLQEIFGADAALYIDISKYGVTYTILDSAAVVAAHAKLVDLRTGRLLWEGAASASSSENSNNNQGGLLGAVIAAAVKQVLNNLNDQSHQVAGVATNRLLTAGRTNGMLYGPRSPMYGKEQQP